MKIMVFDVPAESGGALSVLNDFYKEYSTDEENEYIFVVSKPELKDTKNIKVLRFPWIKKSWFHRLYFDNFIAHKLVKKYKVDEILSLQNIIVPRCKCRQTVYVHNALPFSEYRFSFRENKLLWIYQNVLSKKIFKSIIKANKVIVQTEWMKKSCVEKLNIDSQKILVSPPKINVEVRKSKRSQIDKRSFIMFFYPASGVIFKNHKVILEACLEMHRNNIRNYEFVLTLLGNENEEIKKIYEISKVNKLPIRFVGNLSRKEVFDYYTKSILVFPSFIESSPLPLTEAKMHGANIIVSNLPYAHEILSDYTHVEYFNPFEEKDLYIKLKEKCDNIFVK